MSDFPKDTTTQHNPHREEYRYTPQDIEHGLGTAAIRSMLDARITDRSMHGAESASRLADSIRQANERGDRAEALRLTQILMEAPADIRNSRIADPGTKTDYYGELGRETQRIKQERESRSQAFNEWIAHAFDKVLNDNPDSHTTKTQKETGYSSSSKEWRSFDSSPIARADVFRMIQDAKEGGKSDKEIYREASLALHSARLSGGKDAEIERKEKILRTLYDKKGEVFKL